MKPPAFDYLKATSVAEALEVLRTEDARVIAGGQSLMTMMNFRLARPRLLVDVMPLAELERVFDDQDSVVVGALVRQRVIETDPLLRSRIPLASAAVRHTGHVAIRNRGTLGGTLAHADPSGELPLVALVTGASIFVESRDRGRREIAAEDFFLGYYTSDVEPDEIVTWVRIPALRPGQGWGFREYAQRHGEYGITGAASLVTTDETGTVLDVRSGLLHAADRPLSVAVADDVVGQRPDVFAWDRIARKWAGAIEMTENVDYLRDVAASALRESLVDGYERATREKDRP